MSINSHTLNKRKPDIFDDDFEIIYEGDLPNIYIDESDENDIPEIDTDKADEDDYERPRARRSSVRQEEKRDADSSSKSRKKSRKKPGFPSLLSPAKKTVKIGTKAVSKVLQITLRAATLLIILIIMGLIGISFFKGYSQYGTLNALIPDKNYTLGAYLAVGIILLIYELITFLWALTSQKVRGNKRNYRQDTGRGLLSFIIIGACSYLSNVFCHFIPESPAALLGVKGGLTVYGSLHNTLLILCATGIISCLIRRFFPQP